MVMTKYTEEFVKFIHTGRMAEVKVPDATLLKSKLINSPFDANQLNLDQQQKTDFQKELTDLQQIHKNNMEVAIDNFVYQIEELKRGGEKDLVVREGEFNDKFKAFHDENQNYVNAVVGKYIALANLNKDDQQVKDFNAKLADELKKEMQVLENIKSEIAEQIIKRKNHQANRNYCHRLYLLSQQPNAEAIYKATPQGKGVTVGANVDIAQKLTELPLNLQDLPRLKVHEGLEYHMDGKEASFTLGDIGKVTLFGADSFLNKIPGLQSILGFDLTRGYTTQRSLNTLSDILTRFGSPPGSPANDKTLNLHIDLGSEESRPTIRRDAIELLRKQVELAYNCGYRNFKIELTVPDPRTGKMRKNDVTNEVLTAEFKNYLQQSSFQKELADYEKSQYPKPKP